MTPEQRANFADALQRSNEQSSAASMNMYNQQMELLRVQAAQRQQNYYAPPQPSSYQITPTGEGSYTIRPYGPSF